MSAGEVTAERVTHLRKIIAEWVSVGEGAQFDPDTVSDLLDALEASRAEVDALRAQLAARPAPVAVEVPEILSRLSEWEEFRSDFSCLSYHHSGMGCGIEDRGIHDRYEACEYGWEEAMERVAERMPEEHGELPEIDPSRILKDVDALTRWTPVEECLPEDGESVGFIAKCAHDSWNHGRSMGGKFHRKSFDNGFGGFTTPGVEWGASHWCRLPPAPDAIRARRSGEAEGRMG